MKSYFDKSNSAYIGYAEIDQIIFDTEMCIK